jgi:glycosyltransferase involved in cell wall biosynthesis
MLVEPEDPRSLADGIVRVLTDRDLRAKLISGGETTLARYDEGRLIREIEALYTDLK